eukprot:1229120-Amphidinium_carterae.2
MKVEAQHQSEQSTCPTQLVASVQALKGKLAQCIPGADYAHVTVTWHIVCMVSLSTSLVGLH